MKNNLLEEGDVIEINKKHTVYADIPEHFIFANRKGGYLILSTIKLI